MFLLRDLYATLWMKYLSLIKELFLSNMTLLEPKYLSTDQKTNISPTPVKLKLKTYLELLMLNPSFKLF